MSSPTTSLPRTDSSNSLGEFESISEEELSDYHLSVSPSFIEKIQPGLEKLKPGLVLVAEGSGTILYYTAKEIYEKSAEATKASAVYLGKKIEETNSGKQVFQALSDTKKSFKQIFPSSK